MQRAHVEQAPTGAGRVQAVAAGLGQLQLLVVVLAAVLPLRPTVSGIPFSTVAAALLVLLAAARPPIQAKVRPQVLTAALVGVVLWLVASSAVFSSLEVRRTGNLLILLGLAWVLAQGRLHVPSVVAGLGLGLFVGIAHAVVTRDTSGYEGRITGYLGDPNGAGFVIVTIGCVLLAARAERGLRIWPVWIALSGTILLTVSRTSLFALAAATAWALRAPRLSRIATLLAVVVAWPCYQLIVGAARDGGFFAERAGSDHLRQRLAVVERMMVEDAGWTGLGLGSAHAEVDGAPLWFHNSYRALQVEGGLPAAALLLVALVALVWGLHRVPREARNGWYEGAILAGLICSLNIGFSLTSVSMAVAVGLYLHHWRVNVPPPPDPAGIHDALIAAHRASVEEGRASEGTLKEGT